jgi:hypothetical protein
MIFHAYSPVALKCLEKFEAHFQGYTSGQDPQVLEKVKRCGYQTWLVAGDEMNFRGICQRGVNKNTLLALSEAWRSICNEEKMSKPSPGTFWQKVDQIGEGIPFYWNSPSLYIRRFRQPPEENNIFIFLTGEERLGLPAYELMLLSNLWQLEQGFFLLHSSGVLHKDQLFVFAGPSGAGKSTIAAQSCNIGDEVIDEDQLLLYKRTDGGYSADGWGYGFIKCNAPLRGIFQLIQDKEDRLEQLDQTQVARILLDRHNDMMGGVLTDDLLRQSFHRASDIARQVPGFELHFRKSPDFWKLIDAQFPD